MGTNPFVGRWMPVSRYRNSHRGFPLKQMCNPGPIWEFDEHGRFFLHLPGGFVFEAKYVYQPERDQVMIYDLLNTPMALYLRMLHKRGREYWFYKPSYVNQDSDDCDYRITVRKL